MRLDSLSSLFGRVREAQEHLALALLIRPQFRPALEDPIGLSFRDPSFSGRFFQTLR
ncbi:MAG: hypothetical protein V2A77_05245 [Pseudomonadota bacterium]